MKRLVYNKVSFALAAAAIFLLGIFHDPDAANGDDLRAGPVAPERMPGYQLIPASPAPTPPAAAEMATPNASPAEPAPTF